MQDFFPTLDPIIGATMPTDRYCDGMDQSGFFLVKKKDSTREHLITFVNNELAAVRWRLCRMYPIPFIGSFNNPSQQGVMCVRVISNELKKIFNVEMDPREQINIIADNT